MNELVLYLKEIELKVRYYEGFKKKAIITLSNEQNLTFKEILELFETSDLSLLKFYNKTTNIEKSNTNISAEDIANGNDSVATDTSNNISTSLELNGELKGYNKLLLYNNNMETGLIQFTLEKPDTTITMTKEELQQLIQETLMNTTDM